MYKFCTTIQVDELGTTITIFGLRYGRANDRRLLPFNPRVYHYSRFRCRLGAPKVCASHCCTWPFFSDDVASYVFFFLLLLYSLSGCSLSPRLQHRRYPRFTRRGLRRFGSKTCLTWSHGRINRLMLGNTHSCKFEWGGMTGPTSSAI